MDNGHFCATICVSTPRFINQTNIRMHFLYVENIGNPDLFEGDMRLTPEQKAAALAGQDVDAQVSRGSIKRGLWRGGIMYYRIDRSLSE